MPYALERLQKLEQANARAEQRLKHQERQIAALKRQMTAVIAATERGPCWACEGQGAGAFNDKCPVCLGTGREAA